MMALKEGTSVGKRLVPNATAGVVTPVAADVPEEAAAVEDATDAELVDELLTADAALEEVVVAWRLAARRAWLLEMLVAEARVNRVARVMKFFMAGCSVRARRV